MGILTDLLKEIPLSAVLREQLQELDKRYARLEAENRKFKSENCELKKRLEDITRSFKCDFGVWWDDNYKMRCLYCKNLLTDSTVGPPTFYCSNPKCDKKHILRDDNGTEMTKEEAISKLKQRSKQKRDR